MKKSNPETFSWSLLFIIAGLCFLIFSGFLKLVGKDKSSLFFIIGFSGLLTGVLMIIFAGVKNLKKGKSSYVTRKPSES